MSIRSALPADWHAISEPLQSAALPVADLTAASAAMFVVYECESQILGAIVLEVRDSANAEHFHGLCPASEAFMRKVLL